MFTRFLDTVEYLGNLLPHPITLFAIFCLAILVMSGIAGYFEVSVVDPRPEGAKGRAADGMIHVVSLLNADGLELIVT
ncbi:AbgT family transporter, partial [Vibrio diabolicus]